MLFCQDGRRLTNVSNVAHDDVDEGVLHEGEEHEHCAAWHEDVYSLKHSQPFSSRYLAHMSSATLVARFPGSE